MTSDRSKPRRSAHAAHRVLAAVAVGLFVVGCAANPDAVQLGEPVPILAGVPATMRDETGVTGCYTFGVEGKLVVDPTYGTAIQTDRGTGPVAWRPGYTARRYGSEVAVLDPTGQIEAVTGSHYNLSGGFVGDDAVWPELPVRVFWSCMPARR